MAYAPTASCKLIALIFAEGGNGAGMYEKLAIGHVVQNRVGTPGFANTTDGVIAQRNQFDGYESNRYNEAFDIMNGSNPSNSIEAQAFKESAVAAEAVTNGGHADNTGGATFFALPNSSPWAAKQERAGKLKTTQVTDISGNAVDTKHVFRAIVKDPQ